MNSERISPANSSLNFLLYFNFFQWKSTRENYFKNLLLLSHFVNSTLVYRNWSNWISYIQLICLVLISIMRFHTSLEPRKSIRSNSLHSSTLSKQTPCNHMDIPHIHIYPLTLSPDTTTSSSTRLLLLLLLRRDPLLAHQRLITL